MGWGVRDFKMFVRGGQNCFYFLCVCVWGGGVQYLSFREKITDPLLLINDWSVLQKVPRANTSLIFF